MIFSLQKRFLVFLLLPVTLILLIAGVSSFLYAGSSLLRQWKSSALLRLEKTAHQIQMRLDEKREFIKLIIEAQGVPQGTLTQAFLAERLSHQPGVRFVDIKDLDPSSTQSTTEPSKHPSLILKDSIGSYPAPRRTPEPMMMRHMRHMMRMHRGGGQMPMGGGATGSEGQMHRGSMMMRGPIEISLDESRNFLTIEAAFGGTEARPAKEVKVVVSFDSFMKHILQIGQWDGSYACLVKSDGTYLAHTLPSMYTRKKMGATGDPLEKRVLKEMKTKDSGTVFGEGYPPELVAGFYKIPNTDWFLVLYSKGSVVLAPVVRFRDNYLMLGIPLLLGIGLLIRASTRPVARSIGEISEAAEKVEAGDYAAEVPEDRSDEIGQLKRRFNQMVAGLKQRDLIEHTFGRYVDKEIARELMSKPGALRLGGEKHVVTILMSDLRGFTPLAEKLKPEDVIKVVNRHFSRMIAVVERHKGIIVDFYGDGMLAFFNAISLDVPSRASDAVKAALEMQREVDAVSIENQKEGLPALSMGVGIHTGEVVVGNIGSESRASYGIVGSAVNEAQRIQSSAEGGAVVISDQTYRTIADRVVVARKFQVRLKGLEGERNLYEVQSIKTDTVTG
ncbi:MAG: adenylate/guanylate cyclase domain-containing protein [Deltaproteobacteria bacterium]